MYKMVIADDEPAVRKYIRYIVNQYKLPFFICGEAEDGQQAIELANMHQPDFFILDINMPIMSGLEAAKIIREEHRDAVIYILTAYSQFEYARQAVQFQAAEYLLKPIEPAQLTAKLKKDIAGILRKRLTTHRLERLERQIEQNRQALVKQKLFNYGLLPLDDTTDFLPEIDCAGIQKKLQDCLLERRADKAKTALNEFWQRLRRKTDQPEQFYNIIAKIANYLIERQAEYLISANEANLLRQNFNESLQKTTSASDLNNCLTELIDSLQNYYYTSEQNQTEQLVKWAVEYIHHNYSQELTLEQFSEKLFISTSYFCRIFKKYAGTGFASYLTKIRLEKAREYLSSGRYTVTEVAKKAGFCNISYFSNVFKKHYGCSPSSFMAGLKNETAQNNEPGLDTQLTHIFEQ